MPLISNVRRGGGRLLRFRLRTVFLVLTLFCLFLGLYVKQARDQQRATEIVETWGGSVVLDHQFGNVGNAAGAANWAAVGQIRRPVAAPARPPAPPRFRWLRELVGEHYFCDVVSVTIPYHVPADVNMNVLRPFRDLLRLDLSGTHIDDDDLRNIGCFKTLEVLQLADTDVGDSGVRWVAQLSALKSLSLRGTVVTNSGLLELRHHQSLEHIDVTDTLVTVGGVRQLQIARPNCTIETTARVTRRTLTW